MTNPATSMTYRKSDSVRVVACIALDAGDVYLGVFELRSGTSRPRFVSVENPAFESLVSRLAELKASYDTPVEVWADLPGLGAHLASSDVPGELAGAAAEQQMAGALSAIGLDEHGAEDSAVSAVLRDGTCHAAAVLRSVVEQWTESVGTDDFRLVARAHALEALVALAHAEPGALLALDIGRSTVAAFARTATGRICHVQFDTDQLVPEAERLDAAVVHESALAGAVSSLREHLADCGEHPDAFPIIFVAGTAMRTFDARAALGRICGEEAERTVVELKAASALAFSSETSADRDRARDVLAIEHGLSAVFGLAAAAAAAVPIPAVSGRPPEPVVRAASALGAATRSRTVASLVWALPLLVVAGVIHAVAVYTRSGAEQRYAHERQQAAIYAVFALERAALETKLRHQRTVIETVDRERARQPVPIAVIDDVLACYQRIGAPPAATPSIPNRTSFASIEWSGSQVTVTGSTTYQENARRFAEELGRYADGGRFSSVTPKVLEVLARPVANEPAAPPTYTFTVTATYEPAPAATAQNGGNADVR